MIKKRLIEKLSKCFLKKFMVEYLSKTRYNTLWWGGATIQKQGDNMEKITIYSLPYDKKEIHRKVRLMFNETDVDVILDARGYISEYSLTDSQTVAFINRWKKANNTYAVRERAALDTIEQLLSIKLERQFKVGRFFIDGYDKKTNTAYEIDEENHFTNGKLKKSCVTRQAYIEGRIKCKFVRVKV